MIDGVGCGFLLKFYDPLVSFLFLFLVLFSLLMRIPSVTSPMILMEAMMRRMPNSVGVGNMPYLLFCLRQSCFLESKSAFERVIGSGFFGRTQKYWLESWWKGCWSIFAVIL